ncbi:hypothetical protein EBR57_09215, partial [bacterium]|nr:hypothetical protein [bacterium]
ALKPQYHLLFLGRLLCLVERRRSMIDLNATPDKNQDAGQDATPNVNLHAFVQFLAQLQRGILRVGKRQQSNPAGFESKCTMATHLYQTLMTLKIWVM